jgi:hypothetical protein
MPILPDTDDGERLNVKAISGAEWNKTLDYIQRITPRGDGSTTYAKATKDGTSISAIDAEVDDGGGALLDNMPGRVDFDGKALVTGKEWNKLVDYLQMITPVTDGETATGKSISDGFELSFPPLEEDVIVDACDPGTFYVNVTVTGGSFPFTFAGVEWTASGQTRAVCGSGSQGDSIVSTFYGYPIYTFAGFQNWINSTTTTGKVLLDVGGAGKGYVDPLIKLKKTNTPSAFTFYFGVGGFTFYGTPVTYLNTNNVASYSPAPASLWSQATSSRLTPIMFGSVTLTSGRVISWAPVPDLPWDYDNPPT